MNIGVYIYIYIYIRNIWGIPKIMGTFFGGPYKGYSILGFILGSPYLGKLPFFIYIYIKHKGFLVLVTKFKFLNSNPGFGVLGSVIWPWVS